MGINRAAMEDAKRVFAAEGSKFRSGLERHHGPNTEGVFYAWADTWTTPEYRYVGLCGHSLMTQAKTQLGTSEHALKHFSIFYFIAGIGIWRAAYLRCVIARAACLCASSESMPN